MGSDLLFRQATADDLPAIVEMLADDALGATREDNARPLAAGYLSAFDAIEADPNNELIVACLGAQIVGVLQLTFIPNLTYKGSWRALIEGVRVAKNYRSQGVGKLLFA
ncbi:MAG: GNAT family N-acetyltransferase, partial [Caldilineaceae bacterium]|nr:GNAT family N-acetyltransferase [Caldilineaceae bacterium]